MSASSRPTRRPRSRKPSARLSAVVDLPTPPLPEATAMTAATPGISDCLDIGDAGLCGGLCDDTGCTPGAWRFGGVDIDREEHLAVGDRDRRQHIGVGQGDAAGRGHLGQGIENLLLRYAQCASPGALPVLIGSEPGSILFVTRFPYADKSTQSA